MKPKGVRLGAPPGFFVGEEDQPALGVWGEGRRGRPRAPNVQTDADSSAGGAGGAAGGAAIGMRNEPPP